MAELLNVFDALTFYLCGWILIFCLLQTLFFFLGEGKGGGFFIFRILAHLHWQNYKIFFSRTTGPIWTKLGTKLPWVKGIQVSLNEEPINSHEVYGFFSSLNQHYDIIICVNWFELFSQVSDVAHGPLVVFIYIFSSFCTMYISKNLFVKRYMLDKH